MDGKGIYGKWEVQPTDANDPTTGILPVLDTCGGQFGVTPDSSGASVYHYQVQDQPPVSFQWKNPDFLLKNPDFLLTNVDFITKFTVGCFGPAADGSGPVTLEGCRALYSECGDGDTVTVTTPAGSKEYDLWWCERKHPPPQVLLMAGF